MDTVLILAGAALTLVVGLAATVSDTHVTEQGGSTKGVKRRLTSYGWVSVAALLVAAGVTCVAGVRQQNESDAATRKADSTLAEAQSIGVQVWREQHTFGKMTGAFEITMQVPDGASISGFSPWLERVKKRYDQIKASGRSLQRDDQGEFLTVTARDLVPAGEAEATADRLLFHSRYAIMVSRNDQVTHLMVPSIVFDAVATGAVVRFDPKTRSATITSFEEANGTYNPIAGQVTNWLDLYGAMIIGRSITYPTPDPQAQALARYTTFSFSTSNSGWTATASLTPIDVTNARYDRPGSLTVDAADFRVLGPVPADFPGTRPPIYGTPEPQQ
ncbi:MAG TPA: hypothetical protein VME66_15275 [Candidatus Acidoferrales bacterium]|nr:hypothetical protein [Candidatus Acidoferrales bacterium]